LFEKRYTVSLTYHLALQMFVLQILENGSALQKQLLRITVNTKILNVLLSRRDATQQNQKATAAKIRQKYHSCELMANFITT